MNQFKVLAYEYSTAGALTSAYHTYYFGSADLAKAKYDELNREYQKDDEGKTTFKAYKVSLQVQTYKTVDDVDSFFAQF